MTTLQSKANPQQLEAIFATDSPLLIIAGPGSGKTFTLVERTAYEMYLGTFHSICLRQLEDSREFTRLKRSFTMFDQFDQQYFS